MSDIDTMPVGPVMDDLVAERVMGWEQHCHTGRMMWCLPYPSHRVMAIAQPEMSRPVNAADETGEHEISPFHPSTDIAAAWLVADAMIKKEFYRVSVQRTGYANSWFVVFAGRQYADAREGEAIGDTVPLAICRAALKAVE